MPTVTSSLTLPQPTLAATLAKPVAATAASVPAPMTKPADVPSATVTLSPQAQSALAAASHPATSSPPAPTNAPAPAPAMHDSSSVYESLRNGLTTAVTDVGDAIAGGANAVVDGVETTLSTANTAVKGLLGLPFAAVSKACDVAGALIDEL